MARKPGEAHHDAHNDAHTDNPEGLNPDDPGVRMLGQAVAGVDPSGLLLVHCGDLPGPRPGATRLILDVRERTGCIDEGGLITGASGPATTATGHHCLADVGRDDASAPLPFGDARFEAAVVWPRAHLGKDFSEECLATAALSLRPGGRLYCAVRKQKGGKSLARTMKALLGDDAVAVEDRDKGYHLWVGERREHGFDAQLAAELTSRRYTFGDPLLGELQLHSRPGVFSRQKLDAGTRALLAVADAMVRREPTKPPRRVIDLCAGVGPLGLWAASRASATRVLAVESNIRACALLRANAAANGLDAQVGVVERDGMPELDLPAAKPFAGRTELALLNPPTHADPDTLLRLLDLHRWLAPDGRLLLVVNRPGRAVELLTRLGAEIDGGERDGYYVLSARWAGR